MTGISFKKIPSFFINVGLVIGFFTLSFFLLDGILALFRFPVVKTHPPRHTEVRKNIEFQYEFSANSLGLRYPEVPFKKPSQDLRVYVAGDSFVEGMGVREEETFCALLEKKFTTAQHDVHFINGGFAGTGPMEYGNVFLQVGLKVHPDGLLLDGSVDGSNLFLDISDCLIVRAIADRGVNF